MLTNDMRRRRIVRHPIDPRAKRASRFVLFQAEPESEMNLLKQIPPLIRIRFVSPRNPLKRGAVCLRRFLVEFFLRAHIHIVVGRWGLLQNPAFAFCRSRVG